jgi:hypothetical protein
LCCVAESGRQSWQGFCTATALYWWAAHIPSALPVSGRHAGTPCTPTRQPHLHVDLLDSAIVNQHGVPANTHALNHRGRQVALRRRQRDQHVTSSDMLPCSVSCPALITRAGPQVAGTVKRRTCVSAHPSPCLTGPALRQWPAQTRRCHLPTS